MEEVPAEEGQTDTWDDGTSSPLIPKYNGLAKKIGVVDTCVYVTFLALLFCNALVRVCAVHARSCWSFGNTLLRPNFALLLVALPHHWLRTNV